MLLMRAVHSCAEICSILVSYMFCLLHSLLIYFDVVSNFLSCCKETHICDNECERVAVKNERLHCIFAVCLL